MRSSSKPRTESQGGVSSRMATLHQRLYHALNLGLRFTYDKGQKWSFADIEIQRLVIRAIDAFLECITSETVHHSLVKDSVADIIGALNGILQSKSESILRLASDVNLKAVSILRNSMLQPYVLDVVRALSPLLSSRQSEVAVSCATVLNVILSNLSTRRENEVWEILKETNAVSYLVRNAKDFSCGYKHIEYFLAMASLLSKILWRWPPSRFCVWTDNKLLDVLKALMLMPEYSVKAAVLQLYSTLALCGYGAKKLLENGGALLQVMVDCMDNSNPHSVRMEAFKLAQCLTIGEQGCSEVMKLCCEPLVNAIISGMCLQSSDTAKISKEQISLTTEACRLALITRWAGNHHLYFWKSGICMVLLDILLDNLDKTYQCHSLQKLVAVARDGLSPNILLPLRSYIWDILGWLAAHCPQDFKPEMHSTERQFNTLTTCVCLAYVDSNYIVGRISQNFSPNTPGSESACRAVLMMSYSPCKYIAEQVRLVLSEILKSNDSDCIKYLFNTLSAVSSRNFGRPGNLQVVISLMSLACYLGFPEYLRHVIRCQGIITMLNFVRWLLSNPVHIKRVSLAPHLHSVFSERTCCWPSEEDWEGEDILLVFGLWVLAKLLHYSGSMDDVFNNQKDFNWAQLIRELEEICISSSCDGSRWYAAYVLSYLGKYGFPSKFGRKIAKALTENEHADLELIFPNQESFYVHKVLLMVRCPSLLPPGEVLPDDKASSGCFARQETKERFVTKVHLSSHVDHQSLLMLLKYVYLGYLQAGNEDSVKKLKILTRHCNLQPLLHMLYRRNPKWGTEFPVFDLTPALGPAGHHFSDALLEAETNQPMHWTCNNCLSSSPHLHVHKVILSSCCDYLRALFQSGMRESQLQTVKVPISWNALPKLVRWIYCNKLCRPLSGCLWDNLDVKDKMSELQPYIELCWLAEFWLLEDLHEECYTIITSRLDSCRYLSLKVMQAAADFSQWKLAETAATYVAPIFHQLRDSGELDNLDENLTEMVRAASVRLTREGSDQFN